MIVRIDDFRPMDRNTLKGFARVLLPEGLILHDVAIHTRLNKAWASPPGRPMVGRDGSQMKDPSGKPQYSPTLTFSSRSEQDAFSSAIIAAVRAQFPTVLA